MAIVVEDPLGVPGVGVELCEIWFNVATNPADMMSFAYAGPALSISTGLRAEVRQNANRRRLVVHDSRSYESFQVQLRKCTPVHVEWLGAHVGQLLCVRDPYGSKAFVVYSEAPREIPSGFPQYTAVKLTLNEIDHTEAV